ncbi:uncharacterized protein LOC113147370 [Cyclospora cayetanensis]|uniref:Uncharacterized protein LOC113147370 n=1 Tax=Cyclospora cayetanensis TaxID=88456 RepID=A0A6P6RZU8_9EIME|nr:uncharacterized protein LOC113147370 [Cyclospora cayetanensis]
MLHCLPAPVRVQLVGSPEQGRKKDAISANSHNVDRLRTDFGGIHSMLRSVTSVFTVVQTWHLHSSWCSGWRSGTVSAWRQYRSVGTPLSKVTAHWIIPRVISAQQPTPSPEEIEAEKVSSMHYSVGALFGKNVAFLRLYNYGEMETDIAVPLAQHTAELKAERLQLMHQLSFMTSQIRQLFDSLHPNLVNAPLVIVAKTADDDQRNQVNKLDAKGKQDAMDGILSPCAAFHEEREAEKTEIECSDTVNPVQILAQITSNKLRIVATCPCADEAMAAEQAAKVKELQSSIKYERKQKWHTRLLSMFRHKLKFRQASWSPLAYAKAAPGYPRGPFLALRKALADMPAYPLVLKAAEKPRVTRFCKSTQTKTKGGKREKYTEKHKASHSPGETRADSLKASSRGEDGSTSAAPCSHAGCA